MQTAIQYADLSARMRAAIMASCNTMATDHTDPTAWGAALTLEGAMYDSLSDRERCAFLGLDFVLRSFGRFALAPTREGAVRFLSAFH